MAIYRINYNKVVGQANQISDLASDLNNEIAKLEGLLDRIKREWYGPASEAFQGQLLSLIADMKTTRYNMNSVSTSIKNVASKIQREDESRASDSCAW